MNYWISWSFILFWNKRLDDWEFSHILLGVFQHRSLFIYLWNFTLHIHFIFVSHEFSGGRTKLFLEELLFSSHKTCFRLEPPTRPIWTKTIFQTHFQIWLIRYGILVNLSVRINIWNYIRKFLVFIISFLFLWLSVQYIHILQLHAMRLLDHLVAVGVNIMIAYIWEVNIYMCI